jgi:two-component system sensor histidine kinase GlrK
MKLSIFARLVIGYLAIFLLAMTVSIYTILQLKHLEAVTRSIHFVDNRVIEYEKKLSDVLLSMMRYERKFLIIKDEETYQQFLLAKNDFDMQLREIMAVSDSAKVTELLARINDLHKRYLLLFEEELVYLQSGEQYTSKEYEVEKEAAVNGIVELLKELRDYTQQSTYRKISQLSDADVNASKVAIVIGVVSLISGIIVSIIITVNITRPLSTIKKKTREVADGEFGEDLKLASPPEIAVLAQSFNLMCSRLKELDKMKSDFISLMSHELRTPLTTIREGTNLYLEGLQEGMVPEKRVRLMTIMNEECNRMINLVNSLLDLSKMEAGMMPYNFMNADMAHLIAKITNEMEPLAETKNILLKSIIEKNLPLLKIDTERMLQVLRNLIGNAVKFTPPNGKVKILALSDEAGVKVSVADTGTGISKDKIETVFDKYRQATLANTGKTQGSGLGLSIVRQIVNDHGGKVWVESTSEQGSTFSFVLPVS